MEQLQDGMNLNTETLVTVLQNKLAQATMREAQLEAGVQQLLIENRELRQQITDTIAEADEETG